MKLLKTGVWTLVFLLVGLTGCQDDFIEGGYTGEFQSSVSRTEMENPGGLQKVGDYWVATQRVPLVGVGRVADDIGNSLLGLIDFNTDHGLECMFDDNLGNYAELKTEGVGADLLASAAISVSDIYHTYAGGQTVGFVIKASKASLLSVEVLQTFFIETYLNGVRQESIGEDQTQLDVLKLNLLSPANSNQQTITATTTKPFDEIRLCLGGVQATVLSGMQIFYAFVGDNEQIVITKDNFENASFDMGGLWGLAFGSGKDHFLNPDDEGPTYAVGYAAPSIDLDLGGKSIPAGSEIGFKLTTGGVLDLGLFAQTILDYTYNDNTTEQTKIQEGIGLGLLSGGDQLVCAIPQKNKPITRMKLTIGDAGLLDGGTISYAYYREPIEIDPSYYFGIGNDTITTNSYRLPKVEVGSVDYAFVSGPAMAAPADEKIYQNGVETSTGYKVLTGMTVDGDYHWRAIYTAPSESRSGGKQISYDFTITRTTKTIPICHTPITKSTYPSVTLSASKEWTGGLLEIGSGNVDEEHGAENVIDENTNNYAGTIGGISVASNKGIVAIDAGKEIGINGEMRVGFVLQNVKEFLNLNALNFFRIRVLDNSGNEIVDTTPQQNEGIGLGLLGGNGSKIRYSVPVDKPFRYVELYKSGIADINLSALRVYYAFWEDLSDEDCVEAVSEGIPGDACISIISSQRNNAEIDYKATSTPDAVSLLTPITFSNLEYVIDNSRNTAALVPCAVEIGGSISLGIKFDQLSGGQAIGVIMRKPTGVADLSVLTTETTISVYNDGDLVDQDEGAGFQTAGIKLLGDGDFLSLEVLPKDAYDRIKITFTAGLISGLENYEVYGIYYRPDSDGNGIPDCSENPIETEDGGIDISFGGNDADICVGDAMPSITARLGVGAPTEADSYWLRLKGDNHVETFEVKIDDKNNTLVPVSEDQYLTISNPDVYSVRLYGTKDDADTDADNALSDALILTVHPEETTWNGSVSDDWNNWDNWDKGSPWDCTNVIIPSNVSRYPVLTQSDYKNGLNRCNNICFEDGGQLVNSFYLNQEESGKVWVNLKLEGGRYYLLSSPLKDMVSGDWFISNVNVAKWETIAQSNYPESRTSPYVYQRLWNTSAPIKKPAGYGNEDDKVMPDETLWTPPYNAVNQQYGIGQGFSLMAEKDKNDTYSFCFPKTHTTYHYYSLTGVETGQTEEVHQEETLSGHFIYEEANLWNSNNELTVMLSRSTGSTAYLAGNPFMAHISVEAFMNINGIREIKVYDGTQNNSLVMIDGELISSNGNVVKYIKPMEAFFIMDETSATEREVKYTTSMLSQGDNRTRMASRSASVSMPGKSMLRLTASVSGYDAQCLLRVSRKASEGVVSGEDTRLLIDGEAHPEVAVYTVADGEALDIQQIPATVTRVPLGFYLRSGKGDVELRFDYTDRLWQGWSLLDTQSGEHRSLANVINLKAVESGSTRYVLVKN